MNLLKLTLPTVPSLNHVYRNVRTNLRILTEGGKEWKDAAQLTAKQEARKQGWKFSQNEKLIMELWFFWPDMRRRDCDNALKLLNDTLSGVLYVDDYWVLNRVMDFQIDRTKPRVQLALYPFTERDRAEREF